MSRPSDTRLREIFGAVERRVEAVYGIPVVISDVPNPFTGDLDGAEIQVDYDLPIEEAVFIVAHLFGHTVQWNAHPELRAIGERRYERANDAEIAEVRAYERQACRYSLQLFHEAGVDDVDQWLSDFAACDLAYLEHLYRTGDKRPFRAFWRDGTPRLTPLPIPDFRPTRWRTRWEGVVL